MFIAVAGLISSLFLQPWWRALGLACLFASAFMIQPRRRWFLTPQQLYQQAKAGRLPRHSLASRVLFWAGLALMLSDWFIK